MPWSGSELPVYLVFITLLVAISEIVPSLDKALAILVAATIFYFAGFREGGFDYAEYLAMIELINSINVSSLLEAAIIAKDPLFGLATHIASFYDNNPAYAIRLLVLLAVSTKTIFALYSIKKKTLFLGAYALFLAPGLELAAIRAAIGVGFLLLAAQMSLPKFVRYSSMLLALLSHASFAPAVVLMILLKNFPRSYTLVLAPGLSAISFIGFSYIFHLPIDRLEDYVGNHGSMLALVPPVITLVIMIYSFNIGFGRERVRDELSSINAFSNTSLGLICIGLGAAVPLVTASTRFLEVAWCLMMVLFLKWPYKSWRLWTGFSAFLIFLAGLNIYRGTWQIFSEFRLFYG